MSRAQSSHDDDIMTQRPLPKILLVDDKPNNLLALQDILEEVQAELLLANSGNDALTLVTQHEFALVLLDVQMPEMDGIEVATLMRQVDATQHIPIIFVTAYGRSPEMTFKGYEVGAVDYLHKPIAPEVLRSKVQVFLDLFRQKEDLRQLVAEQKRLTTQLMESRDAALEAVRVKSAFLANMSHEIRTPMNGILGMTDILLDSSLDSDQRDCAEMVKHSANALLTILNDILDFSKMESGKLQIEVLDFDLRVVVDEVMELLGIKAYEKGVELVGLVDVSVPRAVRGDPGRFRQILLNLVGNAIKFTEHGEVVVQVLSEAETRDSVQLRVEVVDTGIGLCPEAQERLFQPFTQADSTTTRRFGGTGLGLSICKQLVELMGGTIHVDSQVDHGSRFWFTIELEKQANPSVIDIETGYGLDGRRVCIVDDHAKTRLLLSEYLRAWGMSCLVAEDGLAALRLLKEAVVQDQPCEFLIVDRHMPKMDGLEVVQQVKADPDLSGIPIVMLTSMGHQRDTAEAQAAGISAYLTKPIHHDRLRKCLSLVHNGSSTANAQPITQHTNTVGEATPRTGSYVLVAEDNLVNQKVVARMLEKLNYRVDVVANGLEAVKAVSTLSYDAVLMDCHMPEMDGYEATKKIREAESKNRKALGKNDDRKDVHAPDASCLMPHGFHLPIIALTANAMKRDRECCLEAGMDDFISKPARLEALEAVLDRWIAKPIREEIEVESQK